MILNHLKPTHWCRGCPRWETPIRPYEGRHDTCHPQIAAKIAKDQRQWRAGGLSFTIKSLLRSWWSMSWINYWVYYINDLGIIVGLLDYDIDQLFKHWIGLFKLGLFTGLSIVLGVPRFFLGDFHPGKWEYCCHIGSWFSVFFKMIPALEVPLGKIGGSTKVAGHYEAMTLWKKLLSDRLGAKLGASIFVWSGSRVAMALNPLVLLTISACPKGDKARGPWSFTSLKTGYNGYGLCDNLTMWYSNNYGIYYLWGIIYIYYIILYFI